MTEKNPRIQKWVEKLRQIEIETSQKTRVRPRRASDKKRYSRFSTQMIRRDIVRSLIKLYEEALAFSLDENRDLKEREKWGRLAAYAAQTINTIIKTYDELKIEKAIEDLKEYVRQHVATGG